MMDVKDIKLTPWEDQMIQLCRNNHAARGRLPIIYSDTPEFAAWIEEMRKHAGRNMADFRASRNVMTVPSVWPPVDMADELAKSQSRAGNRY